MRYHEDMPWRKSLFENRDTKSGGEQIRTALQEISGLSTFLTTHKEAEERKPDAFALAGVMETYLKSPEH